MSRGGLLAVVVGCVVIWPTAGAQGQLQEHSSSDAPALEQTPAAQSAASQPPREKLARIWANEPPLVRLARDKFGNEFTETDAKFFAAVAANNWADFRPGPEAKFDPKDYDCWLECPQLKADRIAWLCSDAGAARLVPSRGIWLRGTRVDGKLDLYRCHVPFSLTIYDCLVPDGINIRHAKLQELDIGNSCTGRIDARAVEVAENVYLLKCVVYGGIDFIEAQIAGDLDMSGGVAFHGDTAEELEKPGNALNLYDAKIDGDVKLSDNFRALGSVRLIGARIGRSFDCANGQFSGFGHIAIDAQRAQVGRSVTLTSIRAGGGVDIRRVRIGSDLECDGGNFIGSDIGALNADLVEVGGQVHLGKGFHAEGEVRLMSAVVAKDVNCDNGHFLNPNGIALNLDNIVIGNNLRIGHDATVATGTDSDLPPGFLARGTIRMYGSQVNRDVGANGGQFETPAGDAIVAANLRASRVEMINAMVKGTVDLSGADIEHDLDLRGSQFDGRQTPYRTAIYANGMEVRGHVYTHQWDAPDQARPFRVDGLMSLSFVTIGKHWNLYGAQLIAPDGYALDASDCRVGGYVNIDQVAIDGRATFSRAKIDGMWILSRMVQPERMWLDMRFAHIWVIKDDRLEDWPPAGQLQLEGLVYDHFDDDSPLSVDDRLAWLRRQYAPVHARRGSPDPAETTDRRSPARSSQETFGQSGVRGRETRAQLETHARPGQPIVPADFEAPAEMAEPYMSEPEPLVSPSQVAPTMPAPMMMPDGGAPAPEDDIFAPMPAAEGGDRMAPPSETNQTAESSAPGMVAPTEVVEPAADEKESTAVATDAPPAPAAPDPAGRRYITQPYTQLASVYRAIGQDEQANTVLVARAERLGELSPIFSAQGLWYRYVGRLIGYGYEPFRAIKIGVAIVIFGAIVFAIGARRNLMAETKLAESILSQEGQAQLVSPTYPQFNPFVYSLDVFLPFADLHQRCYWIPGEKQTHPRSSRNCLMHLGPYSVKWSGVLRGYLWFQTLAGWTLCTLLAAAVTGIVQS